MSRGRNMVSETYGLVPIWQRKRNPGLAKWAASKGWKYRARASFLRKKWHGNPIDYQWARFFDLVSGRTSQGREFRVFIYQYTTTLRNMVVVHNTGIVTLELPCAVPELRVTMRWGAAGVPGEQTVEVGEEMFDKTYVVCCAKPDFAHAVLNSNLTSWLVGDGAAMVPFRLIGNDLMFWRAGVDDPRILMSDLEVMEQLVDLISEQTWEPWAHQTTQQGTLPPDWFLTDPRS